MTMHYVRIVLSRFEIMAIELDICKRRKKKTNEYGSYRATDKTVALLFTGTIKHKSQVLPSYVTIRDITINYFSSLSAQYYCTWKSHNSTQKNVIIHGNVCMWTLTL
jgi:hypothetical protein